MNSFFTEKIKMLDNYIQQLNQAVASNDIKAAEDLQHEIISVYNQEIDGIKTGLNNYSAVLSMSKSVDYCLGYTKSLGVVIMQ